MASTTEKSRSAAGNPRLPRPGHDSSFTYSRQRREPAKRYKDLLYLFDLSDESRGLQERIRNDIRGYFRKHKLPALHNATKALLVECGSPEAAGVARVVEQMPALERPTSTYVSETFIQLVEILGNRSSDR